MGGCGDIRFSALIFCFLVAIFSFSVMIFGLTVVITSVHLRWWRPQMEFGGRSRWKVVKLE